MLEPFLLNFLDQIDDDIRVRWPDRYETLPDPSAGVTRSLVYVCGIQIQGVHSIEKIDQAPRLTVLVSIPQVLSQFRIEGLESDDAA
jgi:hypothetical protein